MARYLVVFPARGRSFDHVVGASSPEGAMATAVARNKRQHELPDRTVLELVRRAVVHELAATHHPKDVDVLEHLDAEEETP